VPEMSDCHRSAPEKLSAFSNDSHVDYRSIERRTMNTIAPNSAE